MRNLGVLEVVSEKFSYDNGCKPLILKRGEQDEGREMPFEIGLSGDQKGQGHRRTSWTRRILTHAAVGSV